MSMTFKGIVTSKGYFQNVPHAIQATTADKASKDGNGRIIANTYGNFSTAWSGGGSTAMLTTAGTYLFKIYHSDNIGDGNGMHNRVCSSVLCYVDNTDTYKCIVPLGTFYYTPSGGSPTKVSSQLVIDKGVARVYIADNIDMKQNVDAAIHYKKIL